MLSLTACQTQKTQQNQQAKVDGFNIKYIKKTSWTKNKELDSAYYSYVTGNFNDSFKRFEALSKTKEKKTAAEASAMLARSYEQQRGVEPKDSETNLLFEKVKKMYESLKVKNSPVANIYQKMFFKTEINDNDIKELSLLAESGHIPAKNLLGVIKEKSGDYCSAFKNFEQASLAGYIPAFYNLSRYYANGLCIEKNLVKAQELETRAYKMGYNISK
ncbi:hypothetical protein SAMN02745728_02105 [Desulfovibrio litoralis DSM 11393]|uniref:Uncharacterized protein n=2 Tax=Desulfovibrio litoralis TaxID=466107 RepID=A0A1M7TJJ3_9BACT|nr:hypothetical protein SAMN02745728_02105 [Desulfovibrio litoralis DSM 11393]